MRRAFGHGTVASYRRRDCAAGPGVLPCAWTLDIPEILPLVRSGPIGFGNIPSESILPDFHVASIKTENTEIVMEIKFAHVNLVARDWKRLSEFYTEVFGCRTKPPQRNLSGEWLDKATSLSESHIEGVHLYLPGSGENAPTIEIFQYGDEVSNESKTPNKEGFGHIAFAVDDVEECIDTIVRNGGGLVGEIVDAEIPGAGKIHFAYARDPEGNIIEIQRWG